MQIKIDPSGLKRTRWYQFGIRFLFGGLVTAGAGMIAKEFGPSIGGLFLAFPAIFPAGATLIEKHEREKKERAGLRGSVRGRKAVALDAAGASAGALGLLSFGLLVKNLLPDHSAWIALAAPTALWSTVSFILWHLRKRMKLGSALRVAANEPQGSEPQIRDSDKPPRSLRP